jgi:DNA-binding response OmpR family regulator
VYTLARTFAGDGGDARAALADTGAYARFTGAFSLWLDEQDEAAASAMRAAHAACEAESGVRARLWAPLVLASSLARIGHLAEAEHWLGIARRVGPGDPIMRISLTAIRATILEAAGRFVDAITLFEEVDAAYASAGLEGSRLWARCQRGRVLLFAGRVAQGKCVLAAVAREAASTNAGLIVRLAADASRALILPSLDGSNLITTRPGEHRRARVLAALSAARLRATDLVRAHLVQLAQDRDLDPLERALVAIAAAHVARADGDLAGATALEREAAIAAATHGSDPEVVPAVIAAVASAGSLATAVVVDRERHRVVSGERTVMLGRHPALRRLFYTLAATPHRRVDKAALTHGIWGTSYRAHVHDGALWVNIKRLRDLLTDTGLVIETLDGTYGLTARSGFRIEG